MSNSNAIEPPKKRTTHHPPPPSLSQLPDDIVLNCLARVPRSQHLNISWVSRNLRSLVHSSQLNVLRSTIHKSTLHVCLEEEEDDDDDDHNHSSFHWFTLNETSTTEYVLVPNPTPFPPHKYGSSAVAVGSKNFFIGGSKEPSTDLWILDTRSGNMTQGPSMSVPRKMRRAAVVVTDGKIYIIGGRPFTFSDESFHEEIQVEVFDTKSETWELAGQENVRTISQCSASAEGKVYMVGNKRTSVYNPREREGERMVHMVSRRLSEGGRRDRLKEMAHRVCVVEDVLFAFFNRTGLMWFDTKLSVWRRLVGRDGKELPLVLYADAMAEYEGRLVVLYMYTKLNEVHNPVTNIVRCMFVSLDRAGGKICGKIDWSGILATVPLSFRFLHCLTVSE